MRLDISTCLVGRTPGIHIMGVCNVSDEVSRYSEVLWICAYAKLINIETSVMRGDLNALNARTV